MPPKAEAVPGVTLGLLMPSPLTIAASSSSDSCAINSSMEALLSYTSLKEMPRFPVCFILSGILFCIRSFNDIVCFGTSSKVIS